MSRLGPEDVMTSRREFIWSLAAGTTIIPFADNVLFGQPVSNEAWKPVHLHHFPNRLYAFVFRTWDLRPVEKIARLLKTDARNISALAEELGLPPQPAFTDEILMRNTMPAIFRLWDILPKEQLCEFLDMTEKEFYDFLHTDITYWHAISVQPEGLSLLTYREPSAADRSRVALLKKRLYEAVPEKIIRPAEEPFAFIRDLNRTHASLMPNRNTSPAENEILFDSRWKIASPENPGDIVGNAVADFVKFCTAVMRQEVSEIRAAAATPPPHSVRINLTPGEFADAESHRVTIADDMIEIRASAPEGIMRGLHFLEDEMRLRRGPLLGKGTFERITRFTPRYIFTYYEMSGDMLKESVGEFCPESYLQHLVHYGVNGIWLQALLSELVPSEVFPDFGRNSAFLLGRLNGLIDRCKKYGINVFLYFNEPRAQSDEFYRKYPSARGGHVESRGGYAMCTSSKPVQGHLVSGFKNLFTLAPGLAGVFLITASEYLTSCYSNSRETECPRCKPRKPYEVVAEVINLIEHGVHQAKPEAEVIAWDWSWHSLIEKDPQSELVKRINKNVALMADFERGTPIERGGIKTEINEYCLSVVGPSPRAAMRAKQAKEKDCRIHAKLTLSTTWELSAVPFLPIPRRIAEKFVAMREHGFDGAMESWTVGAYPSINLEAAKEFFWDPDMTVDAAVTRVATRRYGKKLAPEIVAIWNRLTESFTAYYPMTNGFIYNSPILWGTARNLYFIPLPKPYGNTTIWNPKDDNNWGTRVFPANVMIDLLMKMSADWFRGAEDLKRIFDREGIANREEIRKDIGIVETAAIHFESTANQTRFNDTRNRLLAEKPGTPKKKALADELESLARRELELAVRQYEIAQFDSRIGFESAMQYFYRPANILEKIINCQYILFDLLPEYRKNL